MRRRIVGTLCAALVLGLFSVALSYGAVKTGSDAPDFTLTDVHGNAHALKAHQGKIVVLEWTNYDCPFVRKFYSVGAMQKLQEKLTGKGVVWMSINSSAPGKQGNFSKDVWLKRMEKAGVKVPVLLDADGAVGRAYGAATTPHMFVIDAEGKIAYQGAIDSKRSVNSDDIENADNYVKAAVMSLLDGKAVEVTDTKSYGCSVKY